MPSDKEQNNPKEQPTRRTGSATVNPRPERERERPATNRPAPTGRKPEARKKSSSSIRNLLENIGWGLVIGLPIILVILAIAFRATNGFQSTPNPESNFPTPIPSPTAGEFLAPPAAPAGGTKDRLLYIGATNSSAAQQLFSIKTDGTSPFQLTNSRGAVPTSNKAGAVWSPDGRQVAFTEDGVGIQMVNFDGSGLRTVTYGGFNPVWSPDGKQIAFIKSIPAPDGQGPDRTGSIRILYVVNADGKPGTEKQLAADAAAPSWSPDSKFIAYFSLRNAVMFTVEVANGNAQQIRLPNNLGGWYPTFAPDGNSLLFYGNPNPAALVAGLDLAVASASVTEAPGTPTVAPTITASTSTTATTAAATTVAPSPTPTVIPGAASLNSLYAVNRDGSNLRKIADLEPADGKGGGTFRFQYHVAQSSEFQAFLTARPYYKVAPVISPDGRNVATLYVSPQNKVGIAIVPIAGGAPTLIVEGQDGLEAGLRLNPTFSPDGSRVFYSFTPQTAAATTTPGATPAANQPKSARVFTLSDKKETPLQLNPGENVFPVCCGVGR
jgi:Tol biopolymer transport system component